MAFDVIFAIDFLLLCSDFSCRYMIPILVRDLSPLSSSMNLPFLIRRNEQENLEYGTTYSSIIGFQKWFLLFIQLPSHLISENLTKFVLEQVKCAKYQEACDQVYTWKQQRKLTWWVMLSSASLNGAPSPSQETVPPNAGMMKSNASLGT